MEDSSRSFSFIPVLSSYRPINFTRTDIFTGCSIYIFAKKTSKSTSVSHSRAINYADSTNLCNSTGAFSCISSRANLIIIIINTPRRRMSKFLYIQCSAYQYKEVDGICLLYVVGGCAGTLCELTGCIYSSSKLKQLCLKIIIKQYKTRLNEPSRNYSNIEIITSLNYSSKSSKTANGQ
jgi:hypothetical protein